MNLAGLWIEAGQAVLFREFQDKGLDPREFLGPDGHYHVSSGKLHGASPGAQIELAFGEHVDLGIYVGKAGVKGIDPGIEAERGGFPVAEGKIVACSPIVGNRRRAIPDP